MKKLFLLSLILGIAASVAMATPLCTSVVTTAADFQAQGSTGCQFGDKIFSSFTYSYTVENASGGLIASNVPGSSVTVQFSDLGGNANEPVVTFIANWDVTNGQQGDVRITYNVTAPAPEAMVAASLTLVANLSDVNPNTQIFAYVSGAESICCPGPGSSVEPLGVNLFPPFTTSPLTSETGSDSVTFAPATSISVSKDIFLSAGTSAGPYPTGNEAILTQIDQGLIELTAAPEPRNVVLFALGLLAIVYLKSRVGNPSPT